jgi:hypothetical protein
MARVGRTLLSAAVDSPCFLGSQHPRLKKQGKKRVPQARAFRDLGIGTRIGRSRLAILNPRSHPGAIVVVVEW